MIIVLGLAFAILAFSNLALLWLVRHLMDRLLIQARLPVLTPVQTTPPPVVENPKRRPLFSLPIQD
jgi:hypothetical protein